jgi:hypothetical protein
LPNTKDSNGEEWRRGVYYTALAAWEEREHPALLQPSSSTDICLRFKKEELVAGGQAGTIIKQSQS